MNRKNLIRAMTAFALVALIVGVLVWPTPKAALATNLSTQLNVTWGMWIQHYNVTATVTLLDEDGDAIGGAQNMATLDNTEWDYTFVNAPSSAVYARFSWNPTDLDWGFDGEGMPSDIPPTVVLLNWSGQTVSNVWCSDNWR